MDGSVVQLVVFLGATFAGAIVAGISGFAFALIAAAAWLHVLTPIQTATLISGYGLIVQSYGAWKMRHAADWSRVWPFLIGGAPGVVLGVSLLHWADPASVRAGVGAFLVAYAIYSLTRPELKFARVALPVDIAVGFLNGVLGAMTGFAGILIVIWCQTREWPRDVQRGVFQTAAVAMLLMCGTALGVSGSIAAETVRLFLLGLPALAAGTWIGFKLYGRLDDAAFRKIVLILLLASGLPLIVGLR